MTTKLVKPAQLQELEEEQARDLKALAKVATRLKARLAELAQPTWSKRGRQEESDKAYAAAREATAGIEARMHARRAQSKFELARWDPAARRLAASLEHPLEAAALRANLARAGLNDLRTLAADAKVQGDWLMAHAIAARIAEFDPDPDLLVVSERILEQLDGLEGDRRAEVLAADKAIGESYVQARVHLTVLSGKPLTGNQLVEAALSYGTGAPTPAGAL